MVKSRKQSKRLPAAKRYKIERKVREHRRKARKEAKKNGHVKRLKKDPGIPNLYPFKEQLLKQMEERKEKAEEEKAERKLQRRKEKKRSLQGLCNDAQKRDREYEKKVGLQEGIKESSGVAGVKKYNREFRKVVEASDVVLEVLDARDPIGSRCLEVEQAVVSSGTNKKLILVLNKIDLVPRPIVEEWLKHLRNEFPAVAFKASTQSQKTNLSQKRLALGTAPSGLLSSSACLGAEVLLRLLGNYCMNAGIRTSIAVGVVGLPNVGKSSIINSLKRSRTCTVGATPGVTRCVQEVQLDKRVKLLDSPGVVMARAGGLSALMLSNTVKLEALDDLLTPVESILRRCNRHEMAEHYHIPEYASTHEFLCHLARRMGRLKKGGIPDTNTAAITVLRDWNMGRIKFYTHPPAQHTLSTHVSAEIVKEWREAFDMNSLVAEEAKTFEGLSDRFEDGMVVESTGPVTSCPLDPDGEGGEEESVLEEDMDSELSDSEEESGEEQMMEDGSHACKEMTVSFKKKKLIK